MKNELGPVKVIQVREPTIGLEAALVIDNVALGPAIGGLRMATDVSVEECARLARAMTLKNSAAGLPHGGGKSVLVGNPRMLPPDKERRIRRVRRDRRKDPRQHRGYPCAGEGTTSTPARCRRRPSNSARAQGDELQALLNNVSTPDRLAD